LNRRTAVVLALAASLLLCVSGGGAERPGSRPVFSIEDPLNDFADSAIRALEAYTEVLGDVLDAIVEVIEDVLLKLSFIPINIFGLSFSLPLLALIALSLSVFLLRDPESVFYVLAGFGFIYIVGLWPEAMRTFSLVLLCSVTIIVVGIPIGILVAKSNLLNLLLRPMLDFMQTLSAFVYLIPAVMFFGIGVPAGAVATLIFAMPPIIRLTNLGIREVPTGLIEAGKSFGAHPIWLLLRVEFPLAWPSIMLGVNQTIMFTLSMTVIASMIGAGGLGLEIVRGVQRLDIARGVIGGVSVASLAMILDRLTRRIGLKKKH